MEVEIVYDTDVGDRRDDATAVLRSQTDPDSFAEVFDRHFVSIHGYAARRLGTAGGEDVAAETFLLAFAQRSRFDPTRGSVRAWLYGIATNLIHRRWREEERGYRAHARMAAAPVYSDDEDRAAARISAEAARNVIVAALAGLSADDRDTLLLVAWGGLSHSETAAALGVPVGTVGSRIHRARRHLRTALGDVRHGE